MALCEKHSSLQSAHTAVACARGIAPVDQILLELEKLRPLLTSRFQRAKEEANTGDGLQGLAIPEGEIEHLLDRPFGTMDPFGDRPVLSQSALSFTPSTDNSSWLSGSGEIPQAQEVDSRLHSLAGLFQLTPFDVACLLVVLAADLDLRFGLLFAYLQDDVTRKQPTVDLVLSLLCDSYATRLTQRSRFLLPAPLIKWGLLHLADDSQHGSHATLLAKSCLVNNRIVSFLLGSDEVDDRLRSVLGRLPQQDKLDSLLGVDGIKNGLIDLTKSTKHHALLYFVGPRGIGKCRTAGALALQLGYRLLEVDLERLATNDLSAFETSVRLILREGRLQSAALYWRAVDTLLGDQRTAYLRVLTSELGALAGLNILSGESLWEPSNLPDDCVFRLIEFRRPSNDEQLLTWERALPAEVRGSDTDLTALAQKFRLTPGQIHNAARRARDMAHICDPEKGLVTMADLHAACRSQTNRKLATLARKIVPRHVWRDIVLPEDRLAHLREICNAMKFRTIVYNQWGFEQNLSVGKGLNILFAGPPGTGKTLAADIMAGELGLDLYKIDLSSVVSKYIGETEKNLSRIFMEAESCNAILFFDEADALFGKRTEVRDSHDRYANIEAAYLLQKVEEYDGVVILATNFRRNIDDAFVRRMHFTLEFPFPDEADRLQIWNAVLPTATPCSQDLDLEFMARQFEIVGAGIRNIALAAALLAAGNGGKVNMGHLLHGARREYQKMGKVIAEREFDINGFAGKPS